MGAFAASVLAYKKSTNLDFSVLPFNATFNILFELSDAYFEVLVGWERNVYKRFSVQKV